MKSVEGAVGTFRVWSTLLVALTALACGSPPSGADGGQDSGDIVAMAPPIAVAEFADRRRRIMEVLPDGILLLHARPTEKAMEQWGFVQDPTFLYFSGLPEAPGTILALDGLTRQAHVFLPPAPESFGMSVEGLMPDPGAATAGRHRFDSARPWTEFVPWLGRRVAAGAVLYVDEARRPEATGMPPSMNPTAGDRTLWRTALERTFPSARIESSKTAIMEMRAVKSDAEVALLERNARLTVLSLRAVARRLAPGVRQRETEAAMVDACLTAGGQGPSFWPWTMSGPNAHVERLVGAFFRYTQGDRRAEVGELVRVDIGCADGTYGADVGRTLPVSGAFSTGQAEAWNLLMSGYLAGLGAMEDGVSVDQVRAASMSAIESRSGTLTTEIGRAAFDAILAGGPGTWHIHGVGIDSGEDIPGVLRTGMVVAYEPGFSVDADAYYLEDMILVTADDHRVLSAGLPNTAEEIAAMMAGPS